MDPTTPPIPAHALSDLVRRVQSEFLEMPGLRLTEPQVQRLSGLDRADCTVVLSVLVDTGFLMRTPDGFYMRIDSAAPLKLDLARPPARKITTPAA